MLSSLKIENIAVIEYSEIIFDNGLNILTGETGAGKSIVIDAINAILGERTSRDIIRTGADKAKVTAYFENISEQIQQKLEALGVECEDDSLLITRVISSDGRNICKINGCSVTVAMLKNIGRDLITICGQHDSQYLLSKEHHINFIDAMGSSDELLEDYQQIYREIRTVKKDLRKLTAVREDREQRTAFLKYQIDELTDADIKIGEKDSLIKERELVRNKENIVRSLALIENIINGDGESQGLNEGLYRLTEAISTLEAYDKSFSSYLENLNEFRVVLSECSSQASSSLDGTENSYIDINTIEQRLDELYRLSRKYGGTEEEMLTYLDNIIREYNYLNDAEEMIDELQDKYNELADELFKRGCYLSDNRKQTAIEFENNVTDILHYLDMPDAEFKVDFIEANAGENGMDEVEFLFSANRGQELKPLIKIASGGELSRVMLAVRCVLSDNDSIDSMIFDEIDTGVSGRAAHKIAYKMHGLSKSKQILCVTHLAQIAAYADCHLYIEKTLGDNGTYTKVTSLCESERIREIARIIGGDIITPATLNSAKELIEYSRKN